MNNLPQNVDENNNMQLLPYKYIELTRITDCRVQLLTNRLVELL